MRGRQLSYVMVTVALGIAGTTSGCVDVRGFAGLWVGSIVTEPLVREGFDEDTRVELQLSKVTLQSLTAQLTTSDKKFDHATLDRVTKAAGDALASLSFDGDPLRSYLLFARPGGEDQPALMVLSLFGDDHVELRVIHANDLYGVFYLRAADEL